MPSEIPDALTPLNRLALSYATADMREPVRTLLLLDQRLGAILRLGGEPMIAQIKLAWWRDRLTEDPALWPKGEPLLERLRMWPGDASQLSAMVDGWEELLSEEFGEAELEAYSAGRGRGWALLAGGKPGVEKAARQWAIGDLLPHLGKPEEAEMARAHLTESAPKLPRRYRPLAVLRKLALRAARRGSDPLHGPGALFAALRAGLTGR